MPRRSLPVLLAAVLALSACGSARPEAATGVSAAKAGADCPDTGFDCDFQDRFAKVEEYVKTRPGTVGIVVRDRQTGAVWHNDHSADLVWTASTIKLAMVVDLFRRDREGDIALTDDDQALVKAMLHSSDDAAADELWRLYSGDDHRAFNDSFASYGLTSLAPQEGYSSTFPYWGFQKCTTEDLDRLMSHVLTAVPAEDRALLVREMRAVGPEQQWGVWGAGPAARPGNKDGWSEEDSGWVMNSVGFVGPDERFTLAVMNDLHRQGGYQEGRDTDTEVAELLFGGRF
ncbi:tat pathway signal sequence [Umezawaea endophytica]|uniref:Class A beta-lactamase-related serine hydrolase n=1 Tax=Umezawaea endophytica TaxID=1654476 RepID=A0A9X3A4I8_9PSEU|nr:class A beta-lactamase-related serine hydrolase [Umezawaea endophytica]MCS7481318.1 class A beta-lactamase-related serine hydrolase [Umezawaea endophytica]